MSPEGVPERLTIPGEPARLVEVRAWVERLANHLGFGESDVYDMKVAVSEAASNAIEHGSPNAASQVVLTAVLHLDKVTIEVKDEGKFKAKLPPFDPSTSHRGRGLFMMSALMDQVSVHETEEGTTVKLIKYLAR